MMVSVLVGPVFSETLGSLTYEVRDAETVAITACSSDSPGELVIPEMIEGLPVAEIGDAL